MVPLLSGGGLGILLLVLLLGALLVRLGLGLVAPLLGPLFLGPVVEAGRLPALQLQLLGLGLLVPALAVDVVPPAALDALPEPLHHRAVLGDAAAPVSASAGVTTWSRAVGCAARPDPGESSAQVIVETNAAASIRRTGWGWKIPHPFSLHTELFGGAPQGANKGVFLLLVGYS